MKRGDGVVLAGPGTGIEGVRYHRNSEDDQARRDEGTAANEFTVAVATNRALCDQLRYIKCASRWSWLQRGQVRGGGQMERERALLVAARGE